MMLLMVWFLFLTKITAQLNKLPKDGWPSSDPKLDCALRQLAYEYAGKLQILDSAGLNGVADGLQFDADCKKNPSITPTSRTTATHNEWIQNFATSFYVDGLHGNDANDGSISKPFRTVSHASTAATKAKTRPVGIMLRGNQTHRLNATLELGPEHSGTTFMSYPGETAVLSGGKLLDLKWAPAENTDRFFRTNSGVMVASVPEGTSFIELFADGQRQIRARWPNGNQNRGAVYPSGYTLGTFVGKDTPAQAVVKDKTCRETDYDIFPCSSWLVGGPGSRYDPPYMWHDSGDLATSKPTGFKFDGTSPTKTWSNVDRAIMTVVPVDTGGAAMRRRKKGHTGIRDPTDDVLPQWGGWQAALESRKGKTVTYKSAINEKGMWQDQAQVADNGDAGMFFVENIKEELDQIGEWYLDEDANKLYYKPNSTNALVAGKVRLEAPLLSTLVHLRGAKHNPVSDVSFEGIVFQHSEPTTMRQYYIPSCGDWSIYRGGMIYIEGGAERLNFHNNILDAPGGNGIFAFGYLKDSNFTLNEFRWVGNSAIAFVGRPALHDVTGGFYPQDNLIHGNHAHDTGVYDFESSFYFEAIAGHNTVRNNIMYNGPRAAINFNDGGVGGTLLQGNLIFGHGRESTDHGPVNSWDRCPFKTLRGAKPGKADFQPATRTISKNFVFNGGILYDCLTHDDGAVYYVDIENVLVYGGVQNNNAYHNDFTKNLVIQPHINSNYPMPGYDALNYDSDTVGNSATHNTIIMKGHKCDDPYGSGIAMNFGDDSFPSNTSHNILYNDDAVWKVYTNCDPTMKPGCFQTKEFVNHSGNDEFKACKTFTLKQWQSKGYDKGSTVKSVSDLSNAQIVKMASDLLSSNYLNVHTRRSSSSYWYQSDYLYSASPRSMYRENGQCAGNFDAKECKVWMKFWQFSNGPFWRKCNAPSFLTDPCSCSMVKCNGAGTHITSINVQGDTGVQGPVVWLLDGQLPNLKSLVAGNELTVTCTSASDQNKPNIVFNCKE